MREDLKEQFRRGQVVDSLALSRRLVAELEGARVAAPHRSLELAALSLSSCLWKLYGNKS